MSKISTKTIATMIIILMAIPITMLSVPAKATSGLVGSIGNTPPTTQGFPNLGPLPAGVTPAYTIKQVAYLSCSPQTIGVGQELLVNVWCSPGTYHAFPMTNYFVDIKKPDGTTETIGPFNSYTGDATAWFQYIPDQVGTWQFKFHTEGTYIPAGHYWDQPGSTIGGFIATGQFFDLGASIWYQPASTDWTNVTVQQNPVSGWPYRPMTTDYWTRPVNPMWRDWWSSLGDYPFNSVYYYPGGRVLYQSNYKFTAYVQAPNTCHIVWDRILPGVIAGLTGGYTYQYSLTGSSGTPAIIYDGNCYQSITKYFSNGTTGTVFQCYDLRTGQVYWERGDLAVTPTIIEYNPPAPAVGGAGGSPGHEADAGWVINFIAISGNFLYRFSPATGAMTGNYSIAPLSGGTYYMPGYALTVQDMGSSYTAANRYRLINWTTWGSGNLASRIANNISWPSSSLSLGALTTCYDFNAMLVAGCQWSVPPGPQWCIGCNLTVADLLTGKILWTYDTNDTIEQNAQSPASFVMDRGRLAFGAHGRHWTCFDARTGQQLWTSDQTEYPWGAWFPYSEASYDFNETCGCILTSTYEGVYAINWADGKILWHFSTDNMAVPFEGPYNAEPFFTGLESADGKVYCTNTEHTPSYPRDRAWSMYCLNATTGQLLWKIHNPMTPGAVADGYLTASNSYDGYMYVFGKGKSETTVSASPEIVSQGSSVHIEGTVMDQSPAQPNTPCVSKDSMELQMEVIHESMPQTGLYGNETITGVPVTLTAIASDGSVTDIGTVTTNGYYGTFSTSWAPPKQGEYTIMASFAGDDSYGSSSTATTLSVGPAPATPTPSTAAQVTASDVANQIMTPLVIAVVAIIIAIALATVLILRKK